MNNQSNLTDYEILFAVEERLAKLDVLIVMSEQIKAQIATLLEECAALDSGFEPKESVHESGSDQHRIN